MRVAPSREGTHPSTYPRTLPSHPTLSYENCTLSYENCTRVRTLHPTLPSTLPSMHPRGLTHSPLQGVCIMALRPRKNTRRKLSGAIGTVMHTPCSGECVNPRGCIEGRVEGRVGWRVHTRVRFSYERVQFSYERVGCEGRVRGYVLGCVPSRRVPLSRGWGVRRILSSPGRFVRLF